MNFESLTPHIPDLAKDLRLNLHALEKIESLTPEQLWGSVFAAALASRQPDVIRAAQGEAKKRLDKETSPATLGAVRVAAALMGMNNVYYRARHLIQDEKLEHLHARLRMQGMQSHGAPQTDFELWSVAVSAVNGCGSCLQSHVAKLLSQHHVKHDAINDVLRIAAVVFAVAAVVDQEKALQP